jgi:hypothetical protein
MPTVALLDAALLDIYVRTIGRPLEAAEESVLP